MTMLEFEAWVSDNYDALKSAARRVSRKREAGDGALSYLHEAIEDIVARDAKLPPKGHDPLRWIMQAVKLKLMQAYTKSKNRQSVADRFGASLEALGADTYTDTTSPEYIRARRARQARERRAPQNEPLVDADTARAALFEGQFGDIRWVYQRRRDARLFDGQALQSLAEHIRGRSSRALRGSGRSYVMHGLEVAMDPRVLAEWRNGSVKGFWEGGWTQVSCSTGYQFHGKKWIGQDSPGTFAQCGGCGEHAISGRHDKACALKKGAA